MLSKRMLHLFKFYYRKKQHLFKFYYRKKQHNLKLRHRLVSVSLYTVTNSKHGSTNVIIKQTTLLINVPFCSSKLYIHCIYLTILISHIQYQFHLSLPVSLSIKSCKGANSFFSTRPNSCMKNIKCLNEVFKWASSCSWITCWKCWWYI